LYGVAVDAVTVINYPLGRAIKIVVPRQIMSGDPGDRDVYGAQQHTPLLRLEILPRPRGYWTIFPKPTVRTRSEFLAPLGSSDTACRRRRFRRDLSGSRILSGVTWGCLTSGPIIFAAGGSRPRGLPRDGACAR